MTVEVRVLLMLNGAEESYIPFSVSRTTLGLHGKLFGAKRDAGLC